MQIAAYAHELWEDCMKGLWEHELDTQFVTIFTFYKKFVTYTQVEQLFGG